MPDTSPSHLALLPRPQRINLSNRWVVFPGQQITVKNAPPGLLETAAEPLVTFRSISGLAEPARLECRPLNHCEFARINPNQAYRLRIATPSTPTQATAVIEASTPTGFRHGLATLAQILHLSRLGPTAPPNAPSRSDNSPCQVPEVLIEDWPDFATRGAMLDISRSRVPTMAHLRQVIDQLASWKINHLQLYTEHTFAYAGHKEVWRDASPITPDEARQLDRYCRNRGLALTPNQNCFGHLSGWLRHPRYAPLAETLGEWFFETPDHAVPRTGPFSLCPTDPRSIELIRDLLGQLIPHFSDKRINIGCDETFDVGQGRSANEVARRGRAAVYFDFVNQVAQTARDLGARPMFWADIALSHPDSIHRIPPDMIALAWGYEPDAPFNRWCQLLMNAGLETWVCPGTSSWCSFTGRTTERRSNLQAAARHGARHGASGYLITDWGDLGHRQQWPISLHGLAEGADHSWNAAAPQASSPEKDILIGSLNSIASSIYAFNGKTARIGPWLNELGDVDLPLRRVGGPPSPDGRPRPLRNATALFTDLNAPFQEDPKAGTPKQWQEVLDRLDQLADTRPDVADPLVNDELTHTLAVARFAAQRAILRRATPRPAPSTLKVLKDDLKNIIAEHRRLWLQRSRPGGLEQSRDFYRKVAADLDDTIKNG